MQAFAGRIMLLSSKGFKVTVNIVAHPDQMFLIPIVKPYFAQLGFPLHVDPYVPYTEKYEFSEQEKNFLAQYVGHDRAHYLADVAGGSKMCSGGRTHLHIQPNGDAYRCYSDFVAKLPMIGNIFADDFKMNDSNTPCDVWAKCLGCDRDKVEVSDV
jgi:MoaA/NifB/PqqE/SkfB family radical SAM enzyme